MLNPWYGAVFALCMASVPFLAPPAPEQSKRLDACLVYSRSFSSQTSQNNFHFLTGGLVCLAAIFFGASSISGEAILSDLPTLIGFSCTGGYIVGCARSGSAASDATWWLLSLSSVTLAFSFPVEGWHGAALITSCLGALFSSPPVVRQLWDTSSRVRAPLSSQQGSEQQPSVDAQRVANPGDEAAFFNRITWTWMTPLMAVGAARPLEFSDLPPTPFELQSAQVSAMIERSEFKPSGSAGPGNFFKLLHSLWGPLVLRTCGFKLAFDTLQCTGPILLAELISWLEGRMQTQTQPPPLSAGLWIVFLIFSSSIFQTLVLHQYFTRSFKLGILLKATTVVAVVEKTLRLSTSAGAGVKEGVKEGPGGAVASPAAANSTPSSSNSNSSSAAGISVVAGDAKRLQDVSTYLCSLVSAPYQIIIYSVLLWLQLGPSVLAGIAVMLAAMPLNAYFARVGERLQSGMMSARDARVSATSEVSFISLLLHFFTPLCTMCIPLSLSLSQSHTHAYTLSSSLSLTPSFLSPSVRHWEPYV